jgi:hypothetical protein
MVNQRFIVFWGRHWFSPCQLKPHYILLIKSVLAVMAQLVISNDVRDFQPRSKSLFVLMRYAAFILARNTKFTHGEAGILYAPREG